MRRFAPILFAATVLVIVSLACGLLSAPVPVTAPTMDLNAIGTVILQTSVAAATQTAGASVPADIVNSPTATQTFTPELPTLSPTATLSPTPPLTDTPLVPQISVSKDTNCRVGPGATYDRVGALMVGEVAQIVGRDPTGRYWYIQNPDQTNGYCWLWTEYATVAGNVSALPEYTPPPTPTPVPDFEAAYDRLESCSGWWVNLQLTNTGGIPFKSMGLTVRDMNTDTDLSLYADKFTELKGCRSTSTKDVLNPEERFTVSSAAFAINPDGHKLRATITLCSAPGQKGACVTKVLKFTP